MDRLKKIKNAYAHNYFPFFMGTAKSKADDSTRTRQVLFITHVQDVQYILFNDGSSVRIKGTYYQWYKSGHSKSKELFEQFCSTGKIKGESLYLFRR